LSEWIGGGGGFTLVPFCRSLSPQIFKSLHVSWVGTSVKADFQRGVKHCSTCKKELPLAEFNLGQGTIDGYQPSCRACKRGYSARYTASEDVRIRKAVILKAWRKSETGKTLSKTWRTSDERRTYAREWKRKKYGNDLLFALEQKLRTTISSIKRRRGIRSNGALRYLGYTSHDLLNHLSPAIGHPCILCKSIILTWKNSEVDHITPLWTAFTMNDIIRLNQLGNLRLICAVCNGTRSVNQNIWKGIL